MHNSVYQDHYHIEEYEETEVKTSRQSTRMSLLQESPFCLLVFKYWDNENNY
ncbi:unnamed protein product [Tenebrio molitor]|jgi:hypothetical protein|nr:unnamed protein product [Tenebrio molitor]